MMLLFIFVLLLIPQTRAFIIGTFLIVCLFIWTVLLMIFSLFIGIATAIFGR